jgi:hypothetical protein
MKRLLPSSPLHKRRLAALFSTAIALTFLLAACGGGGGSSPTPTTLPTAPAQGQVSTPLPGQITVGMLADRIAAAWPSVTTIRQTNVTSIDMGTPTASPQASPTAASNLEVVTEVDASGNKRITVNALGVFLSQLISIRGQIWALGYQAWSIPESAVGPAFGDGWSEINTSGASNDPTFNQLVLNLLSNYPVVYSGLSESARARVVEPMGEQTIAGRTCNVYRIPGTTETGQAYDTYLSLDESGLPCSIDTVSFGQTNSNLYEFNLPIEITPPSATPVASPVAETGAG